MGMFDSLYEGARDDYTVEWQTKAYRCNLDRYWVGDTMPSILGVPGSYQVEILGGRNDSAADSRRSLATVLDGLLMDIDNERAHSLPLVNYGGNLVSAWTCDLHGTTTATDCPKCDAELIALTEADAADGGAR